MDLHEFFIAMNVSADATAGGGRGKLSHAPSDVPTGMRRELHSTPKPAKTALKRSVGTPSQDMRSADRRPLKKKVKKPTQCKQKLSLKSLRIKEALMVHV